jgi:hypothetical protein
MMKLHLCSQTRIGSSSLPCSHHFPPEEIEEMKECETVLSESKERMGVKGCITRKTNWYQRERVLWIIFFSSFIASISLLSHSRASSHRTDRIVTWISRISFPSNFTSSSLSIWFLLSNRMKQRIAVSFSPSCWDEMFTSHLFPERHQIVSSWRVFFWKRIVHSSSFPYSKGLLTELFSLRNAFQLEREREKRRASKSFS